LRDGHLAAFAKWFFCALGVLGWGVLGWGISGIEIVKIEGYFDRNNRIQFRLSK